jgi:PAS domain S-box-containing protein
MIHAMKFSFDANREKVSRQIQELTNRLTFLAQRKMEPLNGGELLIDEVLRELSAAVEELLAAEEELREQNEKLEAVQSALTAQRQRYQDLFDLAPDSYLVSDVEGTILEANRSALELLRIDSGFLPGVPLIAFIEETRREAFRVDLRRLHGTDRVSDWRLGIQPRGRRPMVEVTATVAAVRDCRGHAISLRWLLRDVSELLRAEEEIRALHRQLEQRVAECTTRLEAPIRTSEKL